MKLQTVRRTEPLPALRAIDNWGLSSLGMILQPPPASAQWCEQPVFIDPSGECPQCALAIAGAAAGYAVAVGVQVWGPEHKSWGEALTSRESAGAALAGAIVGGTLGAGAAFLEAGTSMAGTTAGTVAQAGLAAGSAVPATLAQSAVTGSTPTKGDFVANAVGNVVGMGASAAAGVLAKKAGVTAAVATMGSSKAVATATVAAAVAGGQALKAATSESATQAAAAATKRMESARKLF